MTHTERAILLRPYIEKAVQSLPDADAIQAKSLYPKWSKLVSLGKVNTNGEPGYRFVYEGDGELYRCVNGNPEFRNEWVPGIYTSALYVRVDDAHAGTLEDPIPADYGMEYVYGRYYLDPEDGKIYLCKRTGEPEGGTVVLAYLPHHVIGNYFEEA